MLVRPVDSASFSSSSAGVDSRTMVGLSLPAGFSVQKEKLSHRRHVTQRASKTVLPRPPLSDTKQNTVKKTTETKPKSREFWLQEVHLRSVVEKERRFLGK